MRRDVGIVPGLILLGAIPMVIAVLRRTIEARITADLDACARQGLYGTVDAYGVTHCLPAPQPPRERGAA